MPQGKKVVTKKKEKKNQKKEKKNTNLPKGGVGGKSKPPGPQILWSSRNPTGKDKETKEKKQKRDQNPPPPKKKTPPPDISGRGFRKLQPGNRSGPPFLVKEGDGDHK